MPQDIYLAQDRNPLTNPPWTGHSAVRV